jgi:hypothetical protein
MLKFSFLGINLALGIILVVGSVGFVSVFGSPPNTDCTMLWAGFSEADDDCDRLANSWEPTIPGPKPSSGGLSLTSGPNAVAPAGPAKPNFKDIFVEIDYIALSGYAPSTVVTDAVRAQFLSSGIPNPSPSSSGINVHFFINEAIPATVIHDPSLTCMSVSRLPSIKNSYFGFDNSERSNSALMAAKRGIFHYGLFIDKQCADLGSSGFSETPGDDFIVSLGSFARTDTQKEGTLMHELGHNLALKHGGTEYVNCKPNYDSVMNWIFQMKSYVTDTPSPFPDYSKTVWPPLNENDLSEPAGIGPPGPPYYHVAIGGGVAPAPLVKVVQTGVPIDYDDDGNTNDLHVKRNLNNFGYASPISEDRCNANPTAPIFNTLNSKKDWSLFSGSSQFVFWDLTTKGGWDAVDPIDPSTGLPIMVSAMQSNVTANQSSITGNNTNQSISGNALSNQTELTIEMVRTARLQLLQQINYEIQILNDSAFADSNSSNITKANFDQDIITGNKSIANFTQSDKLNEAVDGLMSLRTKMDSSFGGDPNDDLIVDSKAQGRIVPLIDNSINVLNLQK